jgi:hypothetical protein
LLLLRSENLPSVILQLFIFKIFLLILIWTTFE